jgi:hypothetical protein
MARQDPHSYADLEQGITEHIDLDLVVDFDSKRVLGSVRIRLAAATDGIFDLDTRALKILSCRMGDGREAPWDLGDNDPIFGSRLQGSLKRRRNRDDPCRGGPVCPPVLIPNPGPRDPVRYRV